MELFKLVGVLFVVLGFILKWDTIATRCRGGHYYRIGCDDERHNDLHRNFLKR